MSEGASGRKPDEICAQQMTFLGEQDGAVERQLKEKLVQVFLQDGTVNRAYLARAVIDGSRTVILGVRAEGANESRLAAQVGSAFASIFNARQHLDIVFLSDAQHAEVSRVCRPFFDRPNS
jgi:hypothetical protein